MKLEQGQLWKKDDVYFRVVEWARLSVRYKMMSDPAEGSGTIHKITKKEFCRLIKGAQLVKIEPGSPLELKGF